MGELTNAAGSGAGLTVQFVLRLAGLYFILRVIDGVASYFMASTGHIMGVHIETDMRQDAFDTCCGWTTPTTTTPRSARSWAASPTTCLM